MIGLCSAIARVAFYLAVIGLDLALVDLGIDEAVLHVRERARSDQTMHVTAWNGMTCLCDQTWTELQSAVTV